MQYSNAYRLPGWLFCRLFCRRLGRVPSWWTGRTNSRLPRRTFSRIAGGFTLPGVVHKNKEEDNNMRNKSSHHHQSSKFNKSKPDIDNSALWTYCWFTSRTTSRFTSQPWSWIWGWPWSRSDCWFWKRFEKDNIWYSENKRQKWMINKRKTETTTAIDGLIVIMVSVLYYLNFFGKHKWWTKWDNECKFSTQHTN